MNRHMLCVSLIYAIYGWSCSNIVKLGKQSGGRASPQEFENLKTPLFKPIILRLYLQMILDDNRPFVWEGVLVWKMSWHFFLRHTWFLNIKLKITREFHVQTLCPDNCPGNPIPPEQSRGESDSHLPVGPQTYSVPCVAWWDAGRASIRQFHCIPFDFRAGNLCKTSLLLRNFIFL